MNEREFTVIENKNLTEEESVQQNKIVKNQTNPILKKFVKFHFEKAETFSVKDLFKK